MPRRTSCTAPGGVTAWAPLKSTMPCCRMASTTRSQASTRAGTPRTSSSKYQITREAQDAWALRSQQRFSAAQAAGKFDAEIVPVMVKSRKGPQPFVKDEHNRPETTAESLAKLKPAFRKDGTITAGNAPGLNTGAAAMLLADRGWAEKNKREAAWAVW